METQKAPNSQSSLEKKKNEFGRNNLCDFKFTTKLQSSGQYGTGTKTEI